MYTLFVGGLEIIRLLIDFGYIKLSGFCWSIRLHVIRISSVLFSRLFSGAFDANSPVTAILPSRPRIP